MKRKIGLSVVLIVIIAAVVVAIFAARNFFSESKAEEKQTVSYKEYKEKNNKEKEKVKVKVKEEEEEPSAPVVETGSCGEDMTWTFYEDGTLKISGSGNMENFTDKQVIPWYSYCSSIENVKLSDGITSIGKYAFYGCESLTSITIPDSVTSIGDYAFDDCDDLTIYGYAGLAAEEYAEENDIPFWTIDD